MEVRAAVGIAWYLRYRVSGREWFDRAWAGACDPGVWVTVRMGVLRSGWRLSARENAAIAACPVGLGRRVAGFRVPSFWAAVRLGVLRPGYRLSGREWFDRAWAGGCVPGV